jgi:hypothetical protein
MRRTRRVDSDGPWVALLALGALLAASGCGRQPDTPAPGVSTAAPGGSCQVSLTGGDTRAVTMVADNGGTGLASVYWMTDERLRDYFQWRALELEKQNVAEEDVGFVVDQAMARNPRFPLLLVKCWGKDITVTLIPGRGSRYEQVPFRPAPYQIGPASNVEHAIPGYFAAQTAIIRAGAVVSFTPAGIGTLNVARFDAGGIAGTFAYDAEAGALKIRVQGTFDFKRPKEGVYSAPVQARR